MSVVGTAWIVALIGSAYMIWLAWYACKDDTKKEKKEL